MNTLEKTIERQNKQMAKEIGVSDVYIGKILKGKTIPSISNTEKILKYFGKNLIIKDNE